MLIMAKTCDFKTSEASTKAWLRERGIIDDYLKITDIKNFGAAINYLTKLANFKFGISDRLFSLDYNGTSAVVNKEAFYKIDAMKGIFYPKNQYLRNLVKPINPGVSNFERDIDYYKGDEALMEQEERENITIYPDNLPPLNLNIEEC
jgi:hypothetical protein